MSKLCFSCSFYLESYLSFLSSPTHKQCASHVKQYMTVGIRLQTNQKHISSPGVYPKKKEEKRMNSGANIIDRDKTYNFHEI